MTVANIDRHTRDLANAIRPHIDDGGHLEISLEDDDNLWIYAVLPLPAATPFGQRFGLLIDNPWHGFTILEGKVPLTRLAELGTAYENLTGQEIGLFDPA